MVNSKVKKLLNFFDSMEKTSRSVNIKSGLLLSKTVAPLESEVVLEGREYKKVLMEGKPVWTTSESYSNETISLFNSKKEFEIYEKLELEWKKFNKLDEFKPDLLGERTRNEIRKLEFKILVSGPYERKKLVEKLSKIKAKKIK